MEDEVHHRIGSETSREFPQGWSTLRQCVVVGGCQVNGYPVGFPNGFVQIAATKLNMTLVNEMAAAPINLGQVQAVKKVCDRSKPDILILQMGHFETTKPILRRLSNGVPLQRGDQPENMLATSRPKAFFTTRAKTAIWDIKNFLKLVLSLMSVTNRFDPKQVERELQAFVGVIARLNISMVVLLSPLPCADWVTLRRRKSVLKFFRREADRAGFLYLDVMNKMLAAVRGKNLYFDPIHLNEKGHALLGQLIVDCILHDARHSSGQSEKP